MQLIALDNLPPAMEQQLVNDIKTRNGSKTFVGAEFSDGFIILEFDDWHYDSSIDWSDWIWLEILTLKPPRKF